jgi:hypothetical protein
MLHRSTCHLFPPFWYVLCARILVCIVVCETCAYQSLLLNYSVLPGLPRGFHLGRCWTAVHSHPFMYKVYCNRSMYINLLVATQMESQDWNPSRIESHQIAQVRVLSKSSERLLHWICITIVRKSIKLLAQPPWPPQQCQRIDWTLSLRTYSKKFDSKRTFGSRTNIAQV